MAAPGYVNPNSLYRPGGIMAGRGLAPDQIPGGGYQGIPGPHVQANSITNMLGTAKHNVNSWSPWIQKSAGLEGADGINQQSYEWGGKGWVNQGRGGGSGGGGFGGGYGPNGQPTTGTVTAPPPSPAGPRPQDLGRMGTPQSGGFFQSEWMGRDAPLTRSEALWSVGHGGTAFSPPASFFDGGPVTSQDFHGKMQQAMQQSDLAAGGGNMFQAPYGYTNWQGQPSPYNSPTPPPPPQAVQQPQQNGVMGLPGQMKQSAPQGQGGAPSPSAGPKTQAALNQNNAWVNQVNSQNQQDQKRGSALLQQLTGMMNYSNPYNGNTMSASYSGG